MEWVWKHHTSEEDLPDPRLNGEAWVAVVISKRWKNILDKVVVVEVEEGGSEVGCEERRIGEVLGRELRCSCQHCPAEFQTKQTLASHLFRSHNVARDARRWAYSTQCICCMKEHHSRDRIVKHLMPRSAGEGSPCLALLRANVAPMTWGEVSSLDVGEKKAAANPLRFGRRTLPVLAVQGPMPQWAMMMQLHRAKLQVGMAVDAGWSQFLFCVAAGAEHV